jgi:adenylate cyclase class 2
LDLSQNHGRLKADPLTPWCDLKPTRFHSLSPVPNAALFPARYTQLMSSRNETEIKFPIPDLPSLAAKLRDLGFVEITPRTHEMNVLFDLPGRPLLGRGEILRIRKYGDSWVLTHKAKSRDNSGPHKVRVETETRVEDGAKLEAVFRALHFEPTFRYEKFRSEWKDEHGHVLVDETPIGNFGEIEGPGEWIDQVARSLGISPSDYSTDTYAGLFYAWKERTGSAANEMTFAAIDSSKP